MQAIQSVGLAFPCVHIYANEHQYVDRLIDGAKRHFGKAVSGDSKLVLGSPVTRSEVEVSPIHFTFLNSTTAVRTEH